MRPLLSTHNNTSRKQRLATNNKFKPYKNIRYVRSTAVLMDQKASSEVRRKAARLLARSRNDLRLFFMRRGSKRVIPQPVYPLETFGEEDCETVDSDSTSTSDSDTTLTDPELDVFMADGGHVQPGRHDTPMESTGPMSKEEQNHTEHLKFIQDTAERMDLSEEAQDEESDEHMDTFFYPDPITSELVPPPTPRLSHIDLPIRSIETDTPNGNINETPEAAMEECEGDLSSITHLIPANGEPRLSSMEGNRRTSDRKTDVSMQDHEDADSLIDYAVATISSMDIDTYVPRQDYEDADLQNTAPLIGYAVATLFSMDIDTSETDALLQEPEAVDLSDIRRRVWDDEQPWQPTTQNDVQAEVSLENSSQSAGTGQIPGSGYIDTSEMDALQEESEDMDLSDIPHRICEQPGSPEVKTALEREGWPKNHTPSAAPNKIPGLGCVPVHTDNFIRSTMTDMRNETLPEQPPAAELASHATSTNTAEHEEVPDRALEVFMEDMENMEAEVLAKVEAERKLLCRKHYKLASEHYPEWHPSYPALLRLEKRGVKLIDRERYTKQEIYNIRDFRYPFPPWKKHAVWHRSLLCVEMELEPLQDKNGEYKEWYSYHTGRGPTGGDP